MTVDEVVAKMYTSMGFPPGGEPDWHAQLEVFAPDARLVRVRDDGVFEFDPVSFRADFEQMIRSGELKSLYEHELWHDTKIFADIAHVLSVYELRTARDGDVICRATKSIQLFQRGGRWWISAMIWRREKPEVLGEIGAVDIAISIVPHRDWGYVKNLSVIPAEEGVEVIAIAQGRDVLRDGTLVMDAALEHRATAVSFASIEPILQRLALVSVPMLTTRPFPRMLGGSDYAMQIESNGRTTERRWYGRLTDVEPAVAALWSAIDDLIDDPTP